MYALETRMWRVVFQSLSYVALLLARRRKATRAGVVWGYLGAHGLTMTSRAPRRSSSFGEDEVHQCLKRELVGCGTPLLRLSKARGNLIVVRGIGLRRLRPNATGPPGGCAPVARARACLSRGACIRGTGGVNPEVSTRW